MKQLKREAVPFKEPFTLFLMHATTVDLDAIPHSLFGRQLLSYLQCHPEAATKAIDVLLDEGDIMARSLAMTIRREISGGGG